MSLTRVRLLINTDELKFFSEPRTYYQTWKHFKLVKSTAWYMVKRYESYGFISIVKKESFSKIKGIFKKYYQLTDKGRKFIELLEGRY